MASLDELLARQGPGWTAANPTPKLDADGLPVPGVYTISMTGPNGSQRIVTVSVPQIQGPVNPIESNPRGADFTEISVEETVKPSTTTSPAETDARIEEAKAAAASAKALADKYAADLVQAEKDNANRTANQQLRGYWVTDKELADITARGNEQKLTQQQINNQLKIASDNNSVSRESNTIAATNAATNAFVAQRRAEAEAAQVEAVRRSGDLDAAKFEREKADRDIANRIAEDKLKLDQLQQQQANAIAQRQASSTEEANVIRREESAQRGKEAEQAAQTTAQGQALQAGTSLLNTQSQAQQDAAKTGGALLQGRANTFENLSSQPFKDAAGLSQGSAGRFGMLGGGLHSVPEGMTENIIRGAYGVSGAMYGGQPALSAAAQAIEGIKPGVSQTPMGQAAVALHAQIQERIDQILNKGKVPAPATAGGPPAQPVATAQPRPIAAPTTQPTININL